MYKLLIVISSLIVLSACSTEDERRHQKYLEADYLTRLELPPDLIFEEKNVNKSQLKLPQPTEQATQAFRMGLDETVAERVKANAKSDKQVIPVFDGLRLQSDQGIYWLEINQNAETLWPVLTAFWENEGVSLNKAESILGFMETDWVSQYQSNENDGFFSKIASKIDKDKLDRFRLRLVRGEKASQSKIFITHSGLQHIVEGDDSHFAARASETGLEVEVLSRLLVFIGLSKEDATGLLSNYHPYAKRAHISDDDDMTLVMTGSKTFVWSHMLRALNRLGLDVVAKNETQGEFKVVVQQLSSEKINGGERDEIAESSVIMQWLLGNNKDASKDERRQFVLQLKPLAKVVNIQILDTKKEPTDSVLAEQVMKGLLLELN